ncbi:MAG: PEP-CTERM sorting domain-containing protein [Planctomycetaceae bacterium]|nr:PEP-CTERM sorting domain-containing protein [Planctomycetaceae bacterium]
MKHTVLTTLALAAVLALAGAATAAETALQTSPGDWTNPAHWTNGAPQPTDTVTVNGSVGTANMAGDPFFDTGGSLTVANSGIVNFNGSYVFVYTSDVFTVDPTSQINVAGSMFFRAGTNSMDFANAPAGGKVSVSSSASTLVVGDQGPATLNIGAGSDGTSFYTLSSWDGGNQGVINIAGATIGFTEGASLGGKLNLTAGAVVNLGGGYSLFVGNSDALNLDSTSRVNVAGSMYFRAGVNSVDFANTPTDGKVSVSTDSWLIVGDQGPATLNMDAGSDGVQFGVLSTWDNSQAGVINMTGAAVTFNSSADIGGQANVNQVAGQQNGLTLNGTFSIVDGSLLNLVFDGTELAGLDWALRWLGDHEATLKAYAAPEDGRLTWSGAPLDVSIFYNAEDNYTYVGYISNIPEPATMSLLTLGGLATLIRRKRQ